MFEMVGRPANGRTFSGQRRVRLGDCSPGGRLRLDAAARYLQDFSDDDTRDAGLAQMTWVVRRTVIDVLQFPTYLETVDMVTWCSGIGSRWAERRVDIATPDGGLVSSATLWVHLDGETQRPATPPAHFHDIFAPSTSGRSVSSRLTLDPAPAGLVLEPWPTRFADFDVMNHINNAIAFTLVEEVLARRRELRAPLRAEVEYRSSIDRGVTLAVGGVDVAPDRPDDRADQADAAHHGWLVDSDARTHIAFRITARPRSSPSPTSSPSPAPPPSP